MNDKAKTSNTIGTLYRVNYSYVANNGQIRSGGIAINATSAEEAKTKGQQLIETFNLSNPKVTGTRPY